MLFALGAVAGCGEASSVSAPSSPTDAADRPDDRPGPVGPQEAEKKTAEKKPGPERRPDSEKDADAGMDKELFEQLLKRRVKAPSLDGGVGWINVAGPIDLKDLKGKFVVLDFWTYCCINCMHVLPELKKLERAYPNNVVVIGVHSAKFDTEKETKNITEAVMRYEIEHPVVNDANQVIWHLYGATGWPALRVIDPESHLIAGHGGEITFDVLDGFFKSVIPHYRKRGSLDETPLHFDLVARKAEPTPLRFPGKVLADEKSGRLFIADSNHNRIVVATLDGKLIDVIGSGEIGAKDGDFSTAQFDHPQGMALVDETLYVADTENHLLRKIDLKAKKVATIAGTGKQGRAASSNGKPREIALNSPWDVLAHKTDLYIAMAGPHQIWKMSLDETEIGPYAGNGREDIVDGPLLPQDFVADCSSFAQPSGLASDGEWLYVADSEGSSIRAVPLDPKKEVRTIVGAAHLAHGRLFEFGDVDGEKEKVKLQHALGVVYHDQRLYVADTYNNKIKVVDPDKQTSKTLVGTGKPGAADQPAAFDEPAGISFAAGKLFIADTNNHRIRAIALADGKVSTLEIKGLLPPKPPAAKSRPSFDGAAEVTLKPQSVKPGDNKITLAVKLRFPKGWKINPLAPMSYYVEAVGDSKLVDLAALGKVQKLDKPAAEFEIPLPLASASASGDATLKVLVNYYYCQEDGLGLCKTGRVVWTVPLKVAVAAAAASVPLEFEIK